MAGGIVVLSVSLLEHADEVVKVNSLWALMVRQWWHFPSLVISWVWFRVLLMGAVKRSSMN